MIGFKEGFLQMRALLAGLIAKLRPVGDRYRVLITALVLNIPLMGLIFLKNLQNVDYNMVTWTYAQTVVAYYALPLMLVVTALFLLVIPFRRVAFALCGTLMGLFVYYLFLDSLVYAVSKVHIDLFWLEFLMKDFEGLGFPGATLVAVFAILVAIFAIQFGFFKLAARFTLTWPRLLILQLVLVLAFGVSQVMHIVAYKHNDFRITSLTPHYPLYMPFTSQRNTGKYEDMLPMFDIGEASAAEQSEYQSLNYPLREMTYAPAPGAQKPNILIIMLESWRYDMVNETVSPNIHALAQRSWDFQNHLSTGNQTTCGLFGLFYGLHATYWTAVKANNALIDNPVLIDVMRDNGYAFGVYADSNFERHKVKDTMFAGIEVHEDFEGKGVEDQDADLSKKLKAFISEQSASETPFMAFAFFKASHYSYYYPKEHLIFTPAKDLRLGFPGGTSEPEKYLNDYMNSIHYNDELVGEVLAHLEALGQMENTVIILTTDHGEEFNDNQANYWGHGSNFSRYQTQVPLIIHAPGLGARTILDRTSHVDVVPTVLEEFFSCTNDAADYSNGRNLFSDDLGLRPLVIGSYFNHAFVLGDDVFEVSPMRTKKYKLWDVNEEAGRPDPRLLK
ncbi:MAG: sulfatase-like hydrolase/transferase, partial [Deltaproteobacteria bacterium]|nr:sulfatase-like hydrolase/transferase [Deltaproteobacteria bacterium]